VEVDSEDIKIDGDHGKTCNSSDEEEGTKVQGHGQENEFNMLLQLPRIEVLAKSQNHIEP